MKIYITGLPSGYEVEHLVRLFYPMAPLTLTPPEAGEDCVWAEKKPDGLWAIVRQGGKCAERTAPLPAPAEAGGETPEFSLASLTYDLLRQWTGIRPPWGKMTGVRPVRLIHDKRAAGWSETDIDHFFLERFDCSEQKYQMAKAIADLQEPILKVGSAPKTYSLYIGIPFCPKASTASSSVTGNRAMIGYDSAFGFVIVLNSGYTYEITEHADPASLSVRFYSDPAYQPEQTVYYLRSEGRTAGGRLPARHTGRKLAAADFDPPCRAHPPRRADRCAADRRKDHAGGGPRPPEAHRGRRLPPGHLPRRAPGPADGRSQGRRGIAGTVV